MSEGMSVWRQSEKTTSHSGMPSEPRVPVQPQAPTAVRLRLLSASLGLGQIISEGSLSY